MRGGCEQGIQRAKLEYFAIMGPCVTLAFLGSAIASASRLSRILSSMSRRHEMIVHCIHVTMPWISTA